MRRITDTQYAIIEQLEQVVEETWPDADLYQFWLAVDTWVPSTPGSIRVAIIDSHALLGSIDGGWYASEVAGYEIDTDGRLTEEMGVTPSDANGYSTIQQIAGALAAAATEGS